MWILKGITMYPVLKEDNRNSEYTWPRNDYLRTNYTRFNLNQMHE